MDEGGCQITALYIPGDMPDLNYVVLSTAGTALQALAATTVLRLSPRAIVRIAACYPAVGQAFWRDYSVDANMGSEWIADLGRRDARHITCEMEHRHARIGEVDDGSFVLPVTRAHLADVTGMTSVHMNRMLQTFRREEIMSFKRKRMTIRDRAALENAAGFIRIYLHGDIPPVRFAT